MADTSGIATIDDVRNEALAASRRVADLLDALAVPPRVRRRLATHAERVLSPDVVVAVVGATGTGKSALCNGIVAMPLLVADDRFSTTVPTMVRDVADHELATRGLVDGVPTTVGVATEGMPALTTSFGNDGNRLAAWRVDVGTPNPLLAEGFVLVDTPAMDLSVEGAGEAPGLARVADAVVLAVPADRPMSDEEVGLAGSIGRRAAVVVAVTKVDAVADPLAAVGAARERLERAGIDAPVVGTSMPWRFLAAARAGDPDLDGASGFPDLIATLDRLARRPAQRVAAARLVAESLAALALVAVARSAHEVVDRPEEAAGVARAAAALEALGDASAPWVREVAVLVQDAMRELERVAHAAVDATSAVDHPVELRARLAAIGGSTVAAAGRELLAVRSAAAVAFVDELRASTGLDLGAVLAPEAVVPGVDDPWPAGAAWAVTGSPDPVRRHFDVVGLLELGDDDPGRLRESARRTITAELGQVGIDAANGIVVDLAGRLGDLRRALLRSRGWAPPGTDRWPPPDERLAADLAVVADHLTDPTPGGRRHA